MWTDGPAMDLGTFGGDEGYALDVTADGTIVVGSAEDASNNYHAFQWTEAGGLRSIEELLTAAGVDLTGWSLTSAEAISGDGKRLAGKGRDSLGVQGMWFSNCDAACAVISREIVAQSFAGLGALGHTGSAYLGGELNAAGDMAAAGQGAPLTGFAYGAFDSDPTTSASIGATYGFGDDLVIGAALGAAGILTLMPFNGSATFSGPSATVFVASKPDAGFNWLVGGSLAGLSGTITRGYLNGSTPATSTGSTTGGGAALAAEAGFTFAGLLADTLVTPFVNVTVSSISYAGYTETGGPFPASFSALTSTSAILRVGIDGRYEFEQGSYLSAGLAYGHNFGNGGTVAGAIPVFALSVPGDSAARDFVEASIGLELPIKDNIRFTSRLALTLPFGTPASIQARAGVTMAF